MPPPVVVEPNIPVERTESGLLGLRLLNLTEASGGETSLLSLRLSIKKVPKADDPNVGVLGE